MSCQAEAAVLPASDLSGIPLRSATGEHLSSQTVRGGGFSFNDTKYNA
jgi:hypothetical protein